MTGTSRTLPTLRVGASRTFSWNLNSSSTFFKQLVKHHHRSQKTNWSNKKKHTKRMSTPEKKKTHDCLAAGLETPLQPLKQSLVRHFALMGVPLYAYPYELSSVIGDVNATWLANQRMMDRQQMEINIFNHLRNLDIPTLEAIRHAFNVMMHNDDVRMLAVLRSLRGRQRSVGPFLVRPVQTQEQQKQKQQVVELDKDSSDDISKANLDRVMRGIQNDVDVQNVKAELEDMSDVDREVAFFKFDGLARACHEAAASTNQEKKKKNDSEDER
jgi:hypothetical protein